MVVPSWFLFQSRCFCRPRSPSLCTSLYSLVFFCVLVVDHVLFFLFSTLIYLFILALQIVRLIFLSELFVSVSWFLCFPVVFIISLLLCTSALWGCSKHRVVVSQQILKNLEAEFSRRAQESELRFHTSESNLLYRLVRSLKY